MTDNTNPDAAEVHPRKTKCGCLLRGTGWALMLLLLLLAFGAIVHDGPFGGMNTLAAWIWLAGLVVLLLVFRRKPWRGWIAVAGFLVVAGPWLAIQPSNDRTWSAEYARTPQAVVEGDTVTMHNVRSFRYTTGGVPTEERWITRTVHFRNLRGIDLFMNYWGSPWMAHPIMSFDFGPDGRLAFSVETRRERGETYAALGGIYKMYELIYSVSEESDVIGMRTHHCPEELFVYRLTATPELARARFLEYVARVNALHARPEWYRLVRGNCTTSIFSQIDPRDRDKRQWDWRILVNGKMDRLLYEQGLFAGGEGLGFEDWRNKARIHLPLPEPTDPGYSAALRAGKPGFGN